MDAPEPQKESLRARQGADDVIGDAESDPGIRRVGPRGEQFLRRGVRLFYLVQAVEMFFFEDAQRIGLHPRGQSQREERIRISAIAFYARLRGVSSAAKRAVKAAHPPGVGLSINSAEKSLVVQEEVAGQDALAVKLLEKIARRDGYVTEGIVRVLFLPAEKCLAGLGKFLLVKKMKSGLQLRHGDERRAIGRIFRARCRREQGGDSEKRDKDGCDAKHYGLVLARA